MKRWRDLFDRADDGAGEPGSGAGTTVELRLRLQANQAVTEWKRAGQADFAPMKQGQARGFAAALEEGTYSLPPLTEMLWPLIERKLP